MARPLVVLLLGFCVLTGAPGSAPAQHVGEPAREKPLPPPSTTIARVHEASDLVRALGPVSAPVDEAPTGSPASTPFQHHPEPALDDAGSPGATLAGLVRAWIEPPLADAAEVAGGRPNVVDVIGDGDLLLIGDEAQHAWLDAFLRRQRTFDGVVHVRCELLGAPAGLLARHGIAYGGAAPQRILSAEEGAALSERLRADGASVLSRPELTMPPLVRAELSVQQMRTFIAGYSVEQVEPGPRPFALPHLQTMAEGTAVEARATPLADGRLGVGLRLIVTEIEDPVPTYEHELDPTLGSVTVWYPALNAKSTWTKVALQPGHTVAIASSTPDPQRDVLLLLTVDVVRR